MSKFTKKAIMESFIRLLNNNSFDSITVKDIVNDCGINRNTFYYNFSDIYALVDEIIQEETNKIMYEHKPYSSWNEAFLSAANFALQNKRAIFHLHNSSGRAQLEKYLQKVVNEVVISFVEAEAAGNNINEEDKEFIAEFYTYALLGFLNKWIDNGMQDDFKAVIDKTSLLFQNNIKQVITLFSE